MSDKVEEVEAKLKLDDGEAWSWCERWVLRIGERRERGRKEEEREEEERGERREKAGGVLGSFYGVEGVGVGDWGLGIGDWGLGI
jgi:hypothetical protein